LKAERNNQRVAECISKIEEAAKANSNLMPHIIEAVENYTTLGEIADAMRKIFGEYQ
jgi:methylmalonyl-CoA mutase N-terminal domain/subunit